MGAKKMLLAKRQTINELFVRPVVSGDTFSPLTPVLGLQKNWPCHPLPLFMVVEPAPPGEDNVSSPEQTSFHSFVTPTNPGRKR